MKKIIINGRFLIHRVTGVERYAREILAELDTIVAPGEVILAIPPEIKEPPIYHNIKVIKVGTMHNRMWEHISFPWYVHKKNGISLNLCNVAPLIDPGIVCIHDMKVKAHPEYFSWKFRMWYELLLKNETKRAKKIITVSEFSKSEIMKYYKVASNKIVVIPNAWQHYERIGFNKNALKKYNLEKEKYYFAMGSMEPNKNFEWIAKTALLNPTENFAVAGSINKKIFAEGLGFECPDNMHLLGYVTDEEAKTLMKECKAFVFPSFYEGFGIPPLEAISAGAKQIVVSDIPVMHEVFEDSAKYIDPRKPIILTEDYVKNNIENHDKVVKKYSWRTSAQKLCNLLRNTLK